MLEFAREHALGLLAAVVMHAALAAVLVVALPSRPIVPMTAAGERAPVQAVAVREADLRGAEQRQSQAREAELRRQQQEARQRAEAEQQREAEIRIRREREEAEQRAQAEAAQQAQAERQAREQRVVEERRQAEEARRAEEARKVEEARKAEQQRREAEVRQQAEAEARRKAEEAARQEAARQAAAARAQQESQAELARQVESEQRRMNLQGSSEYSAWLAAIEDQVARNWSAPLSARPGLECEVRVNLIPGMQVVNTEILRCNGDEAVRRSIIVAVERASPLPRPSDAALFERTIVFIFKPQD